MNWNCNDKNHFLCDPGPPALGLQDRETLRHPGTNRRRRRPTENDTITGSRFYPSSQRHHLFTSGEDLLHSMIVTRQVSLMSAIVEAAPATTDVFTEVVTLLLSQAGSDDVAWSTGRLDFL